MFVTGLIAGGIAAGVVYALFNAEDKAGEYANKIDNNYQTCTNVYNNIQVLNVRNFHNKWDYINYMKNDRRNLSRSLSDQKNLYHHLKQQINAYKKSNTKLITLVKTTPSAKEEKALLQIIKKQRRTKERLFRQKDKAWNSINKIRHFLDETQAKIDDAYNY